MLIADLDDVQRTSKNWADHRANKGLKPLIRSEIATPRTAYDMAGRADVLASGGFSWTVIRVEDRGAYMEALEAACVGQDIRPFARFLGQRTNPFTERQ